MRKQYCGSGFLLGQLYSLLSWKAKHHDFKFQSRCRRLVFCLISRIFDWPDEIFEENATKFYREPWTISLLINFVQISSLTVAFLTGWVKTLYFFKRSGNYIFFEMSYHGDSKVKKKISEVKVWTSKAAKPSHEIQKQKSKKVFKFNLKSIFSTLHL